MTTWQYDLYGRVTNKIDTLSASILRYKYDAAGQLTNRWRAGAGGTNHTYTYDAAGNLTHINYPTNSSISLSYDALNRLTTMVDGVGTTAYSYDEVGQLLTENGPWENDTVSYTYEDGVRTSLALEQLGASAWVQTYGYDDAKRLTSIASPAGTFGYSYVSPQHLLTAKISLPNGSWITNSYDGIGRLTETALKNSGNAMLNRHAYVYNPGHQRTRQTFVDGNYIDYAYDDIGQLTSAKGKESGGMTRMHEDFGYKYDAAGNLNQRTNNALVQTFTTDDLNQLDEVTRSGTLTVSGTTSADATSVTVNGYAADLYSDETFAKAGFGLVDGQNTFTAIATESTRSSTNSVSVNLPASVDFTYDANGNLTGDSRRSLAYDAENQLIRVTVAGEWEVRFTYDGKMRKRTQQHHVWDGNSWELLNEKRYVYDGMLVIQERDQYNTPRVTYTRGRDLSGTFEGAGGIGGLLARTDNGQIMAGAGDPHAYYHADGNGNVTMLVNSSQIPVAKYHYDSYGNKISATGPLAEANTYRFSSKEYHAKSGLYYYGYRFYDPNLQRWVNRDPIGELGGVNLGVFALNNPLSHIDTDGRILFMPPDFSNNPNPIPPSHFCQVYGALLQNALNELALNPTSPVALTRIPYYSAMVARYCKPPPPPPPPPGGGGSWQPTLPPTIPGLIPSPDPAWQCNQNIIPSLPRLYIPPPPNWVIPVAGGRIIIGGILNPINGPLPP